MCIRDSYNTINPLMGMVPGIKAFVAAVFGGIGILPGAMFGGFFIGIDVYKRQVVSVFLMIFHLLKNRIIGK